MAGALRAAGERVVGVQAEEAAEVLGANTIAELVALDARMRATTANRLMAAGVTIYRPDTCVIDAGVEVEADAIIEPFVQLLGRTRIGAETRVRSYSVIENCTVGDRVMIRQSCVLADSSVGDGADIGPFARMRPGCEIGEDVHIGNFVEVKKSKLHAGVKAGHLAYLGDAEIGEETNIGAGVITCNYDGVRKHMQHASAKDVFVGSDSTLVAPIDRCRWGVHRGGFLHHKGRTSRGACRGSRPAGNERRMGRGTTRAAQGAGTRLKRRHFAGSCRQRGPPECRSPSIGPVILPRNLLESIRLLWGVGCWTSLI